MSHFDDTLQNQLGIRRYLKKQELTDDDVNFSTSTPNHTMMEVILFKTLRSLHRFS